MSSNASSGGVGFFGLLGLLFIGLRLGHVIDWRWWVVLIPLWAPTVLAVVLLLVLFIVGAIAGASRRDARRRR